MSWCGQQCRPLTHCLWTTRTLYLNKGRSSCSPCRITWTQNYQQNCIDIIVIQPLVYILMRCIMIKVTDKDDREMCLFCKSWESLEIYWQTWSRSRMLDNLKVHWMYMYVEVTHCIKDTNENKLCIYFLVYIIITRWISLKFQILFNKLN